MKKLTLYLHLCLLTTWLTGCSSGLYSVKWDKDIDKTSSPKVCIAKKQQILGAALTSPIFLDDKRIADIRVGQWFCTNIPSGLHSLQMEFTTLAINFSDLQIYYYFIENGLIGLHAKSVDANFFKNITSEEGYEDISGERL